MCEFSNLQQQLVLSKWIEEMKSKNLYIHPSTTRIMIYLIQQISNEGIIFGTVKEMASESGTNYQTFRNTLNRLEDAKIIFRNRGVVGIHDYKDVKLLNRRLS